MQYIGLTINYSIKIKITTSFMCVCFFILDHPLEILLTILYLN